MVKFTHYLVTRFNVPVEGWNRDKSGQTVLDERWLNHRIPLFRTYCVPTIMGQSKKNFQWILYCDKNTPVAYRLQIETAVNMIPGVMIREVSHLSEMMENLRSLISNADTPYVITTRLDNDDGLGNRSIQTIQEHFKETDKLLLNLGSGVLYDTHEKVMTKIKKSQRNHYTSLIEEKKSAAQMLTVFGFPHDRPPEEILIENIVLDRAWLKIIHDKNMKSRLKGKPILTTNKNYFGGVSKKEFPVSFTNTIKYIGKRIVQKINDLIT